MGRKLAEALEARVAEAGHSSVRVAASMSSVGFCEHLGYATTRVHDEGTHSMTKALDV